VEDGSAFCERCGLDSDRLGSAGASVFRVCSDCSSSTCANCWNQIAGRCLACSPFQLASASRRASPRIVLPGDKPIASVVARAVAAEDGVAAGAGRRARRSLGKVARTALVAVVVLAAVVGVRAVTIAGGTVAAQEQVGVETLVPASPAASDAATPTAGP
jgi:hypothetical protein